MICSDVGGMAEKVLDGVNGLHFRVGDADSLAAAIQRAMSSPGLWDRLREGIGPVHSMAEHAEVLTVAYESLIAARRATVVV